MASCSVLYEVKDGVGILTLNRPAVLNALNADLAFALAEAAERAATDREVWVVVVRGAGRAFSSGMDRTALSGAQIDESFFRHWIQALNCLEDMDKLVIAVCHGYCIGGGLQLAAACDVRLATEDAVLGLGATEHGLIPDGSILRLARIIGLGRAKELTLLNDHVRAEEARAMGLVNRVVPEAELEGYVRNYADTIAANAPLTVDAVKYIVGQVVKDESQRNLARAAEMVKTCFESKDYVEGRTAFMEKRKPVFTGT